MVTKATEFGLANMTQWMNEVTLEGRHATLRPLTALDHDELCEAIVDGQLDQLWYTSVPTQAGMTSEIKRRIELGREGKMLPFTVLDSSGTAVGMTTYMNVDAVHRRLEIGSTWYARRVQRTALNTECKFLLLQHAFESLDCIAVELRTSYFNHPSRRAIERLGAKLDGVLRNHTRHCDGTLRDTCVYSIIQSEWRTVRSHLMYMLG